MIIQYIQVKHDATHRSGDNEKEIMMDSILNRRISNSVPSRG
jgi:hypothetical protein